VKKRIRERIEELKRENDQINNRLEQLNIERNNLIQKALSNNGAITELEKLLKLGDGEAREE